MTNPTRTRADVKMHIDNWGPGIAGKVVLAMDGGKIVASMPLSDLLESCSPPDANSDAFAENTTTTNGQASEPEGETK